MVSAQIPTPVNPKLRQSQHQPRDKDSIAYNRYSNTGPFSGLSSTKQRTANSATTLIRQIKNITNSPDTNGSQVLCAQSRTPQNSKKAYNSWLCAFFLSPPKSALPSSYAKPRVNLACWSMWSKLRYLILSSVVWIWSSESANALSMTKALGYPALLADAWSEQAYPHSVRT